jgi:peptide/nickel transport system substrate-binding protein
LEELGWRDEDRDGVREAQGVDGVADGEPFALTLLTSSDSQASQAAARIVRAQLADCGIRVTVEVRPGWELLADGPSGPIYGRRFDLAEMRMALTDPPPCDRYLSSQVPRQGSWDAINVAGYANPEYDAACLAAVRALPGTAAYDRYHQQTQVLLSEDLPALPLFVWPRIAVATPKVRNFGMDPTSESELCLLEMLDVETESPPP